ncbi:MAG: hypothetical protein ABI321_00005, partial [Polyangia bacterium]
MLSHTIGQALAGFETAGSAKSVRYDLAGLIAGCPQPFILVLDDFHHIRSEESAALVDLIIANLPPASTLVLAG